MSIREIIRFHSSSIKLGVVDSQIASVRTQTEQQTAVRYIEGNHIGLASAVGRADVEALTESAKESLIFEIPFPVEPEKDASMAASHVGESHDVGSLRRLADTVLEELRAQYPQFVFSHGVEQNKVGWSIESDAALDLGYERVTSQMAFIVKEKGSGNIIDTFVGVEGTQLDVSTVLDVFHEHLQAYGKELEPRTGRHKVIFPGLSGMAGGSLMNMFRSDLGARSYSSKASFFDGKLGDGIAHFHPSFGLVESRDPEQHRVCPFDMEGVVRAQLQLPIVQDGMIQSLAANKRDSHRFGVPSTGTAVGDIAQLPMSGFGRLVGQPTAAHLSDLLDDDGALLVWFVAGGDTTRTGDMGLPAQVILAVDGAGRPVGRIPGCTLRGNLMHVFGKDFVGITEQKVDPFSDEGFFVTHMSI